MLLGELGSLLNLGSCLHFFAIKRQKKKKKAIESVNENKLDSVNLGNVLTGL